MTARPHVRLISDHGELVGEDVCLGCVELSKKIAHLSGELTKLRNEQERAERRDPLDGQVMEVCTFHKRLLSPTWKIVRKKGAYKDVRDRLMDLDAETGQPAFTVRHLQAATVGLSICEWTRQRKIRSASWLFGQTAHVQWMIDEAIGFKRSNGTSALTIVDELGRGGLERLAERCECGHIRLEHEKERPELDLFDPPCAVHGCDCVGWSEALDSRIWRWVAEQEALRAEDVA